MARAGARFHSGYQPFRSNWTFSVNPPASIRKPCWRTRDAAPTLMTGFAHYCAQNTGRRFDSYEALHRFSTDDFRTFWRLFLDWSLLFYSGEAATVCTSEQVERALFFPDIRLNYADILLSRTLWREDQPGILSQHADGSEERLTRKELRERVEACASGFKTLGIAAGSRVAMIGFNDVHAAVATLAAVALGATVGASAPEMGVAASVARFAPLAPHLLICHWRTPYGDWDDVHRQRVLDIIHSLPSLRGVVLLDRAEQTESLPLPYHLQGDLIAKQQGACVDWPQLPFNHPLFVLFSSGTTGAPKAIVHGAGGTLLEHLKEHRLHCNLRDGDRLFYQTSTAWMMWNWELTALASGVELVLYDGPVPDPDTLWKIVADKKVTVFGTSPAYLQMGARSELVPGETLDLSALRAILSTGSILYPEQQQWVTDNVKDLPVLSISGGTDIIGCFVMCNPNLPVYAGEPQCKGLGFDLDALPLNAAGSSRVGELVCRKPFPSRPIGFLEDPVGRRFHDAYFAQHPPLWTHGDLVEFTPEGSVVMHGRSDGTINIRGIRIGPAEIYRVLESFAEIEGAMAVEQRWDSEIGHARLVLLLVLRPAILLKEELQRRIRKAIGRQVSSAHVPAIIIQVPALPITHTGKHSERSARDAVNGEFISNRAALRNPECLDVIAKHPDLDRPSISSPASCRPLLEPDGRVSESALTQLWEDVLGIAPIGRDEDFIDIGANSISALQLLRRIEAQVGMPLPITLIYGARTIANMAARLQQREFGDTSDLVLLKSNVTGRPLFIVHAVGGNVMHLANLGKAITHDGPVYAVKARGLSGEAPPLDSVPAMAGAYLESIRAIQPAGPYLLCGHSFGGLVAFEMARQLLLLQERAGSVILLDTRVDERYWPKMAWINVMINLAITRLREIVGAPRAEMLRHLKTRLQGFGRRLKYRRRKLPGSSLDAAADSLPENLLRVREAAVQAMADYYPPYYNGEVVLLRCKVKDPLSYDATRLWKLACHRLIVHEVRGNHRSFIEEPHLTSLADTIAQALRSTDCGSDALKSEAQLRMPRSPPEGVQTAPSQWVSAVRMPSDPYHFDPNARD
jgi:acetoacetyl-CoA synthetase